VYSIYCRIRFTLTDFPIKPLPEPVNHVRVRKVKFIIVYSYHIIYYCCCCCWNCHPNWKVLAVSPGSCMTKFKQDSWTERHYICLKRLKIYQY